MVFCDKCVYSTTFIDPDDIFLEDLKRQVGVDYVKDICDELNTAREKAKKTYSLALICKLLLFVRVCNPGNPAQCVDVRKACKFFKRA